MQRRTQRGKFESAGRGTRRENSRGQAIKVEIHQQRDAGMERRIILQIPHRHELVCSRVSGCPPPDGGRLQGPPSFSWRIFIPFLFLCFLRYLRLLNAQLSADCPGRLTSSLTSFLLVRSFLSRLCTSRCVAVNSDVNALRCSIISSHASSASIEGS